MYRSRIDPHTMVAYIAYNTNTLEIITRNCIIDSRFRETSRKLVEHVRVTGRCSLQQGLMWLMLQQETPEDYVLATGVSHSIKDLLEIAFQRVNLRWEDHVQVDERFKRPADPYQLLGNPAKAEDRLGWNRSVDFPQLIELMVDSDVGRCSLSV